MALIWFCSEILKIARGKWFHLVKTIHFVTCHSSVIMFGLNISRLSFLGEIHEDYTSSRFAPAGKKKL